MTDREALLSCYRSGQMSAAQFQRHCEDDPELAKMVDAKGGDANASSAQRDNTSPGVKTGAIEEMIGEIEARLDERFVRRAVGINIPTAHLRALITHIRGLESSLSDNRTQIVSLSEQLDLFEKRYNEALQKLAACEAGRDDAENGRYLAAQERRQIFEALGLSPDDHWDESLPDLVRAKTRGEPSEAAVEP